MNSINKTIEELHYLRLKIGNIRQVLEIISLRVESQPIPFYAPLAENPDCEPVALFPMTIQPVNLNNFIVELSSEYYLEMSAKEVEKRLNDKIKELEKQEKMLEDTLKNHSEEAQKELEGDVRNITEFMTDEEYEKMKQKPKEKNQPRKIDYEAERKQMEIWAKEEEELEKAGKLTYFDLRSSRRNVDEIPMTEFTEMPAVKSTIVERKKENKEKNQLKEMKDNKSKQEMKEEANEIKEKKESVIGGAFTGGIGERKKTVKKQTTKQKTEIEQKDGLDGVKQKKVSLFKQRMGNK